MAQTDKLSEKGIVLLPNLENASVHSTWKHSRIGTSNFHLVHHLLTHWTDIFHFPCDKRLLSMSTSNQLVESTLFAISACHLRHVAPGVLQHQIAEYSHQSQVVSGLRKLLNVPSTQLNQSDADGMMLCATLLNMITFTIPASQDTASRSVSWVLEPNDDCRAWLDLQIALRPLLLSTSHYFEKTIKLLSPIFFGSDSQHWEFKKMPAARNLIPPTWTEFFELGGRRQLPERGGCVCESNTERGSIFLNPVVMLVQLRELDPVASNVYKAIQFLAKIQHGFRALLLGRGSKALWLLGCWLGLLCRFDGAWWCRVRARRDYLAICMLLRQRHLDQERHDKDPLWEYMMMDLMSFAR